MEENCPKPLWRAPSAFRRMAISEYGDSISWRGARKVYTMELMGHFLKTSKWPHTETLFGKFNPAHSEVDNIVEFTYKIVRVNPR